MTLDLAKLRAETLALIDGIDPDWGKASNGSQVFLGEQGGVATLHGSGRCIKRNSRLIAAAPTLAADTLRLLDEIERLRDVARDIVEAWEWWTADEYDRDRGGLADSIDAARAALPEGGPDDR